MYRYYSETFKKNKGEEVSENTQKYARTHGLTFSWGGWLPRGMDLGIKKEKWPEMTRILDAFFLHIVLN